MLLQEITVNTGNVTTRNNSKYRECYYKIYQYIQGMLLQEITVNTGSVSS